MPFFLLHFVAQISLSCGIQRVLSLLSGGMRMRCNTCRC
ncbi:hypothetical protein ECANGB1_2742 [Enterospora canceri]|uniref:Uncharacterized protein n=1 Tax=Enterospora canceri TaxID=1081671 RepID=A0A1Y1S572_9MICR|nr:hypothetical protein ECANGB1_2742 [Enterospora canceri]